MSESSLESMPSSLMQFLHVLPLQILSPHATLGAVLLAITPLGAAISMTITAC